MLCSSPMSLLLDDGSLAMPSYCFSNQYIYNRDSVKHKRRLKEWEFYQISDGNYCIQLTYGQVSYAASIGCSVIDMKRNTRVDCSKFILFNTKNFALPFATSQPHALRYDKDFYLSIQKETTRKLDFCGKGIELSLSLCDEGDAICYCADFANKGFYFNIKKVFPSLSGSVKVNGVEYSCDNAYAILDSGRGCWPYRHEWYWGMGRGYDGNTRVEFNIGRNLSEKSLTNENALFIDGVGYKLGALCITPDPSSYRANWQISSPDGSFVGYMTPEFDNYTTTNLLLVHNTCHQVFGKMYADIDLDGKKYRLDGALCFIEHARNRW